MINSQHLVEAQFEVHAYDLGADGLASMVTVCNFLQEAAGRHVRGLGFSVEQLLERGITWFLSRLHVRMQRMPAMGERVLVQTWPSELQRIFAVREFRMLDSAGAEIGVGTSAWLLFDIQRGRPIRLLEEMRVMHDDNAPRMIDDDFARLPLCEPTENPAEIRVRFSDLDLNGHVNNAVYAGMLLDSLPGPLLRRCFLHELEIEFRAETHQGELLTAHSRSLDGEQDSFRHAVISAAGGQDVVRAVTRWRERG